MDGISRTLHLTAPVANISPPAGGFPSIRHNKVRDITATLLSEVCSNVEIEPHLQPVTGEHFPRRTANCDQNARLDVVANGVWGGRFERTFFDVRIFNPYAKSNTHTDDTKTTNVDNMNSV